MELTTRLLKEAEQLEAKAARIREAAKLLGGDAKQRRSVKGKRHFAQHRLTCGHCGTRFLGCYGKPSKGGPFCSASCTAKAYRERKAKALQAQAVKAEAKPHKGTTLIPGDGVSRGA